MKKLVTLFVVLSAFLFSTTESNSQNFFVKIGGGYALGLATSLLHGSKDSATETGYYGSYGQGILPSFSLGYLFNKNIGIEVNTIYLLGKKFEVTSTKDGKTKTTKHFGGGIMISPSIMVQAPMKSMTPYARLGAIIGLVKVKSEYTETGTSAKTGTDKFEESGKMGLGMNGAFGIKFKAGKMLDIFAELYGQGMTYGPETRTNTETYTGDTPEKVVTYSEEFPKNASDTELTPRHPFSNFGLNIGVVLTFGKTPKTK